MGSMVDVARKRVRRENRCVGAGVVGDSGRGSGDLRARHRQARERGGAAMVVAAG